MSETPEIPEAQDPFSKQVAITIALLAVIIAVVENKGDNAKTDAIIQTNEASNTWARYQAKSLKLNLRELELSLHKDSGSPSDAERPAKLKADIARYEGEMKELDQEARGHQAEAAAGSALNDRCDLAGLFLQISIVVASVAILSRQHLLWHLALGLAAFGAARFFLL